MELTGQTFDELTRIIHRVTGLVVGKDKSYLVKNRLASVAKSCGCDTFEALTRKLKSAGGDKLHDALIEAITTKETSFFRDHWFFESLQEFVLPECGKVLSNSGGARQRIRIKRCCEKLVQSEESITTIGIESGFGSSQYFSRVFKKYVGVTPTDYRRLFGARPSQ